MKDGPNIAAIAALLGDPARANMLTALMHGQALTATELAQEAGVVLSTASGHLGKLQDAGLVDIEKQGRHRYFRLSGADVASVLEGLMGVAARTGHLRVRTGPRDPELRRALCRACLDWSERRHHLAGALGAALLDHIYDRGWAKRAANSRVVTFTKAGVARFDAMMP